MDRSDERFIYLQGAGYALIRDFTTDPAEDHEWVKNSLGRVSRITGSDVAAHDLDWVKREVAANAIRILQKQEN